MNVVFIKENIFSFVNTTFIHNHIRIHSHSRGRSLENEFYLSMIISSIFLRFL